MRMFLPPPLPYKDCLLDLNKKTDCKIQFEYEEP